MFAPSRLFYSLQHRQDLGLLGAAVSVSVMFSATPFLLPTIADEYGISLGHAGWMSTAQVGGFALTAFAAGRTLRTHRRYLVGGSVVAFGANVASTAISDFTLLLGARAIAGAAGGLLVWLAWANAMRASSAMRNVASIGPLSVLVAAPVLSWLAHEWGSDAVFLAIALVSWPPALFKAQFAGDKVERTRMSPSRSNIVLVIVLGIITMAGSALFVFGAAIGVDQLGMNATVVSLAYSANALAGLIGARRLARDQLRAGWVAGVAASAALVAFGGTGSLFFAGLTIWGFFFWMATPNILRSVAGWSLAPDERIGDAQSTMALGRAAGPAIAAVLIANGSFSALGAFSVGGLLVSAAVVWWVQSYRQEHAPPRGAAAAR